MKFRKLVTCVALVAILLTASTTVISSNAKAAALGRFFDIIGLLDDLALSSFTTDVTRNLKVTFEALDGVVTVSGFPADDALASPLITSLCVYNDGEFEEYLVDDHSFELDIPLVDATHIQGNEVSYEFRVELEDGTNIAIDGNFVFQFGGGGPTPGHRLHDSAGGGLGGF